MNRENVMKLALFLEDLPSDRFNISYWVSGNEECGYESDYLDIHDCGTAGCIAGWALALKNGGMLSVVYEDQYYDYDLDDGIDYPPLKQHEVFDEYISDEAREWLGLDIQTANRLFIPNRQSYWYEYANDYGLTPDTLNHITDIHPKHAADMLYRILNGEIQEQVLDKE